MAKKASDAYCQSLVATETIGSAAADTPAYEAFSDSYKPEDLIGFVIHRIEYSFENEWVTQLSDADRIKFGISFLITQPTGGFEQGDPGVIDWNAISRHDVGAVAADVLYFVIQPLIKDFTGLPGGGRIVHPVNLFFWTYNDAALGASITMHAKIDYTIIQLTPDMHKELWQAIYVRQA